MFIIEEHFSPNEQLIAYYSAKLLLTLPENFLQMH